MKKNDFKALREKIDSIRLDASLEREKLILSKKDENDVYHVAVALHSEVTCFDPYSNKKELNNDVFDYIERMVSEFPPDASLSIDFKTSKDLSERKGEIESLYRNHYLFAFDALGLKKKRSHIAILIMTQVGILFLLAFAIVSAISNRLEPKDPGINFLFLIATELLSTAEWVLFWEAFDKIFFDSTERKRERFLMGRLASANITFKEIDEE